MDYIKIIFGFFLSIGFGSSQPVEVSKIPTFVCETRMSDLTECRFHEMILREPEVHFRIKTKGARDDEIKKISFDNSSNIHTFPRNFCGRFPNLEVIYANRLSIQELKDNALTGCRQLQSMSFSVNNLKRINARAFAGLSHLQELYVADNKLEVLDPEVFRILTNLRILSLNGNQLRTFPTTVMQNLRNVEELKLFNNKLTKLNAQEMIKYMPKLKILYIADNEFSCKEVVDEMLPIFRENGVTPGGLSVGTEKRDDRLQRIEWIHCYP
ncbi:leucine-rich repeat-containing protein 15-like [Culicoides brevitarsis]|uniref:leucine-rich repeat-containing protein 15-like n=1 Tax=Culicoides brevitarsis TaxID=469753 RepID=UPI00307C625E